MILYKQTDISNYLQVDDLYGYVVDTLGSVDAVINNAGVFGPIGKSDEIKMNDLEECISINLLGTFYSMRKAVQVFKKQGNGGKIINLSGGGATKGRPMFIGYAITKTAIVRATETFADEVKEYGIDINAMAPGTLDTDMTSYILENGSGLLSEIVLNQVKEEKDKGVNAMKKAVYCAKFLLSSKSDGLTGRLISAVWDDLKYIETNKKGIINAEIYTLRRTTKV